MSVSMFPSRDSFSNGESWIPEKAQHFLGAIIIWENVPPKFDNIAFFSLSMQDRAKYLFLQTPDGRIASECFGVGTIEFNTAFDLYIKKNTMLADKKNWSRAK